jgi:hypothetical protein
VQKGGGDKGGKGARGVSREEEKNLIWGGGGMVLGPRCRPLLWYNTLFCPFPVIFPIYFTFLLFPLTPLFCSMYDTGAALDCCMSRTGWRPVQRRPSPFSAPSSSRARWRSSTRRTACPRPPGHPALTWAHRRRLISCTRPPRRPPPPTPVR